MISLFDALPETVTVDGRAYKVLTDFADWCWFDALWYNDELTDEQRAVCMFQMFDGEIPPDVEAAGRALIWFYQGGEPDHERSDSSGSRHGRIIDFQKDAPYILSSFMDVYRIDLQSELMHWWRFLALLYGLPEESRYGQIIGYRAVDLKDVPKHQKKHYEKMKHIYAIEKPRIHGSAEERYQEMIDRVRKAHERAAARPAAMGKMPLLRE